METVPPPNERPDYLPTKRERLRPSEGFEPGIRGADDATFADVLGETVEVLEPNEIPYVLIGGIASSGYGRPRWTHDIDVLVRPDDSERALEVLQGAGYATEKTEPRWLFKAFKHRVMVDLIFCSTGGIYLDPEMLVHAAEKVFLGRRVRFVAPEDLLIMKAIVHDEEGPRHWHDALGLISAVRLDWEYLLMRASRAPRRVLSLLIYAQSLDLFVPNRAIRDLFDRLYGD
jgi:predicted nucleotidyltransferase